MLHYVANILHQRCATTIITFCSITRYYIYKIKQIYSPERCISCNIHTTHITAFRQISSKKNNTLNILIEHGTFCALCHSRKVKQTEFRLFQRLGGIFLDIRKGEQKNSHSRR